MWSQVGAAGHEWQISIENCCSGSSLASVNAATRGTIDRLAWLPFFWSYCRWGLRPPKENICKLFRLVTIRQTIMAEIEHKCRALLTLIFGDVGCLLSMKLDIRLSESRIVSSRTFSHSAFSSSVLCITYTACLNLKMPGHWQCESKNAKYFTKSHKISCGGFFDNNLSTNNNYNHYYNHLTASFPGQPG